MSRFEVFVLVLAITVSAPEFSLSQQIRLPPAVAQPQTGSSVPVTTGDPTQQQQAAAANAQRQLEIRRDSEKMAQLTQELKDYLANKEPGVMSIDALKKVEQIEKLAHSLKGKMKQSF